MKNRFFSTLLAVAAVCFAASAMTACASTPPGGTAAGPPVTAQQQAINSATVSYQALDAAIIAADAAVKAGALKGQDARNALAGFVTAKAGLDAALAVLKAPPPGSAAPPGAKP